MARIAGVDIPDKKRGEIALTYIFGIGKSSAQKILAEAGVDANKQVIDWTDDESARFVPLSAKTLKLKVFLI